MMSVETIALVPETTRPVSLPATPRTRIGERVLAEPLFRSALVRERRRADRSNQGLALIVVSLWHAAGEAPSDRVWRTVAAVLKASRRDTDVLGWLQHRQAMALLMTDVPRAGAPAACEAADRIHRDLMLRLDPDTRGRLACRVHVHPEEVALEAGCGGVDPLIGQYEQHSVVQRAAKRALDIAGSGALLLLLAPLFAIIAALVKLTSQGPVFFRQTRIGERATPFTMLKFRTMKVGASAAVHQDYVSWFIKSSAASGNDSQVFKLQNDSRVTAVGRVLRRTSLDELPQLWNVMRGEMSLVGPRPPLAYEVEQYQAWHCRRVRDAKPGITGLWQVKGRSRTTFDEMVRLDLRYAKARSLWLDVKILLATPRAVIGGKGAC